MVACIYRPIEMVGVINTPAISYSDVDISNVIINVISEQTGLHPNLWIAKSRRRNYVFCRQMYFYFMRLNTTYSLNQISQALFFSKDNDDLNKLDHSTVINAISRINNIIDFEHMHPDARRIEKIKQQLKLKIK